MGTWRVLVVDDLEQIRAVVRRTLSAHGYLVDGAATPAEALGMNPAGYDAILIDARLGTESGTDLLNAVLAEHPAAATKCLVITGARVDGLPDGVACLAKPFRAAELLDAVRALHQQEPAAGLAVMAGPGAMAGPDAIAGAAANGDRTIVAIGADPATTAASAAGPGTAAAAGYPDGTSVATGDPARYAGCVPGGREPEPADAGLRRGAAWRLLAAARELRLRERCDLADLLHDGPVQDLTAAVLGLHVMRHTRPADHAERLVAMQEALDAAAGALQRLIGRLAPIEPSRLTAAIAHRAAWLSAAPLTVETTGLPDMPGVAPVAAIADIVELLLATLVPEGRAESAHVALGGCDGVVWAELTVCLGEVAADGTAVRRALGDLASALGSMAWSAELGGRQRRARVALP